MQFQFSFKHMPTSTALKEYAEEKIRAQVNKFVTKPIEAHVTFSLDKHLHIAHCSLKGGDGFSLQVEHSCDHMYGSVDKMLSKLFVQLKKKKDKLKGHKGNGSHKRMRFHNPHSIDYHNAEIDAADIIAYEESRRRAS